MNQTIEVTLDEKGQIRIPAILRHQLGLEAGTRLIVETDDRDDALLRLELTGPYIKDEGGILVVAGLSEIDVDNALLELREERAQKLLRHAME